MEADGISERFAKSIELHGLKFNRLIGNFIKYNLNFKYNKNTYDSIINNRNIKKYIYNTIVLGDGDSSVLKKLLEIVPYGSHQLVQKIECRNHILRNYSTKLSALTKNTKYPPYLRQLITKNIIKFCVAIRKAIQYRKNLNINNIAKIKGN